MVEFTRPRLEVNPAKQFRVLGPMEIRFLTVPSSIHIVPNGESYHVEWDGQSATFRYGRSVSLDSALGRAQVGLLYKVRGFGVSLTTSHKVTTIYNNV